MAGDSPVEPRYQASFLYKGNSADDDDHHGDFNELQGIANGDPSAGDPYWYLSRNRIMVGPDIRETILYRVHYAEHLAHDFSCDPKTVLFNGEVSCTHVGDIDYHLYNGEGYLLGAYNDCNDGKAYIVVFRADDLGLSGDQIVVHALIDVSGVQGNQCPWVTVSSNGHIYSGSGKVAGRENEIYEYTVSWAAIQIGGSVSISSWRTIFLRNADGSPFIAEHWQGADFSSDETYFFLTNGYDCGCGFIHVFEVTQGNSWHKLRTSTDEMPFKFEVAGEEEPEGCSCFDMNGVDVYHPDMPRGELHVVLLNNDWPTVDNAWIKHYSSIIDVSNTESVNEAYNYRWGEGAWDGSILRIEGVPTTSRSPSGASGSRLSQRELRPL